MSFPGLYPAFSIASTIVSNASLSSFTIGANPPSSPIAVESPLSFKTFFRLWYTSAHIRKHSLKLVAPTGIIMNSCTLNVLSACFPPFIMFIIGIGNVLAFTPPKYLYRLIPKLLAAALATARDTPNVAFAPNLPLFSVPSISINFLSISTWSNTFIPSSSGAIISFTFATAFVTPFPRYLDLSPSLNSTASKLPVDAPDGTIATPFDPSSVTTSTCTVGFPLESSISSALISSIAK